MALSDADRIWLTGQFNTVHERINEEIEARSKADKEAGSSVHHLKEEVQASVYNSANAIANAMNAHKETSHNPAKTLGFVALLVAVGGGVMEGFKFLVHLVKDGK